VGFGGVEGEKKGENKSVLIIAETLLHAVVFFSFLSAESDIPHLQRENFQKMCAINVTYTHPVKNFLMYLHPNCVVITGRCKHVRVDWIPIHTIYYSTMSRQHFKQRSMLSVPCIDIRI